MSPDRWHSDDGIALIYVIFVTMILAGLATLFVARAVFESRATGTSANREAAIHVGEAGAENLLGDINNEGEDFATKVVTEGPTSTSTTVADHVYDPDPALSGAALQSWEEAWVVALAEADWELGQNPSSGYATRVIQTDEGQAFGIRAKYSGVDEAHDAVFGVGFVPTIDADNRQVRVIKMLIARRFFSPEQALLTGGNLAFGGNGTILAPDCDATNPNEADCIADIHSNGSIDISGSAHEIQGSVTASGTITGTAQATGGQSGGEQTVTVPDVSARDFYGGQNVTYNVDPGGQTVAWYDLCPDGTVRIEGSTPCIGTLVWEKTSQSSTFRGWQFKNGTWQGSAIEAGVFYVYQANAQVTGTSTDTISSDPSGDCYDPSQTVVACDQRAISIFVEADTTNATTETNSGNLEIRGNPSMVAAFPDLLFVTDNDLKLQGTSSGGKTTCDPTTSTCTDAQSYSGLILVGEQADISGTVELKGALIVSDLSAESTVVTSTKVTGAMTLDYDDNLKVDLSGRVTIEFWNEL